MWGIILLHQLILDIIKAFKLHLGNSLGTNVSNNKAV